MWGFLWFFSTKMLTIRGSLQDSQQKDDVHIACGEKTSVCQHISDF
jgi:hypothetical protein